MNYPMLQTTIMGCHLCFISLRRNSIDILINPTFDITIEYPESALHLVELLKKNQLYFVQKKSPYPSYSFHSKSRASKMNMTNNNNCFCPTKKIIDSFGTSKKENLFFHLTKKNDLFRSATNIDLWQFNSKIKIYL